MLNVMNKKLRVTRFESRCDNTVTYDSTVDKYNSKMIDCKGKYNKVGHIIVFIYGVRGLFTISGLKLRVRTKNNFLISQPKHMLWVLKRIVSCVKTDGTEIIFTISC